MSIVFKNYKRGWRWSFWFWKLVDKLLTHCLQASCAWKFENWLKTNKCMTLNVKSRLKVISGQDIFKMNKSFGTHERGCRWCFLKLKFVDQSLTYCLWVLCAWKFENWLKTHNDMTLNIKPCSNLLPLQNEQKNAIWSLNMNMIFIYVQFYPNIHKAAITITQSVRIRIHNPQSQPTTRLIQVSCWRPSNKC